MNSAQKKLIMLCGMCEILIETSFKRIHFMCAKIELKKMDGKGRIQSHYSATSEFVIDFYMKI